jgi:hypothetical protein
MMNRQAMMLIAPVRTSSNSRRSRSAAPRDAGEDQDRDAVAQTALGDLLAQPHQEHRAGHQADHAVMRKAQPGVDHQPRRAFQRDRDAERLEKGQPSVP